MFFMILNFSEMQSSLDQLLLPPNCASSSVVGYQTLRSGEQVYCDGGWMVRVVLNLLVVLESDLFKDIQLAQNDLGPNRFSSKSTLSNYTSEILNYCDAKIILLHYSNSTLT